MRQSILFSVALVTVAACLAEAVQRELIPFPVQATGLREHLGAENDNIAKALYSGRGFADPFIGRTGSTAWMPPLLPSVVAGFYCLCDGDRSNVITLFYLFQLVAVCFVFAGLHRFGQELLSVWMVRCILIAVAAGFCVQLFFFTHSHVFEMLMGLFVFWGLVSFDSDVERLGFPRVSRCVFYGLAAGFCALVAPAIAISWAVITVRHVRRFPTLITVAFLAAATIVSPWMGRNLRVFEKLVPIKSNAGFEGWQAIVVDDDGVLDASALSLHPYSVNTPQRELYGVVGESQYLDDKTDQWLKEINENRLKFAGQISNRIVAAFVIFRPAVVKMRQDSPLFWFGITWKVAITICLCFLLFSSRKLTHLEFNAVLMLLLTILPYLIVSYYERYMWQLLPIQVLILFLSLARLSHQTKKYSAGFARMVTQEVG